jgi:hypothetical protein
MPRKTIQEKIGTIDGTPAFLCRIDEPGMEWFIDSTGKWLGGGTSRLFFGSDGRWHEDSFEADTFFAHKQDILDMVEPYLDQNHNPKIRKSVPLF